MSTKAQKIFFPALTGYRAIAAWMIFVYHFLPFNSPKYPLWIKNIVSEFHIGVDMFFVLSGFLITYRYFEENPINFKKYLVNRVARIYPMYFLLTAAVFGVWYFQNGYWDNDKTVEMVFSFTMTKALFAKYFFAGIPQGWTLTLEELFYFTAPFYFIMIRKKIWWLVILPVAIFIFGSVLKESVNNLFENSGFLQYNISFFIIEFFAGIGLAVFMKHYAYKIRKIKFTYLGLGVIILYLLLMHFLRGVFDLKSDTGTFISMAFLSVLGIAPLLYGLIFEKTIIQNILGSKPMVLLGKSSYIFYLIHKGFMPIFIDDYISDNKLVNFILLNIIAIILFHFLEEPLNKWIRRKFTKPQPAVL